MISKEEFCQVFEELTGHVADFLRSSGMPQDAIDHITKTMHYNIPGGKMNRGLSVVEIVKMLDSNSGKIDLDLNSETIKLDAGRIKLDAGRIKSAVVLGWMVEWLQGFFLVADDIMDESEKRRGQPCWYLLDGIGKKAINDCLLLQSCMHHLLKFYFGKEPFYTELVDQFLLITFKTELGQLLDLMGSADKGVVDYDRFTLQRYWLIAQYKTANYSFVLPARLAFILCNVSLPKHVEEGLIELGKFFQVQDDYLDVYGDTLETGKIGTDIQEGKCSWMSLKLLELMDQKDQQIFKAHYGQAAHVDLIKQLYCKYDLKAEYERFHDAMKVQFESQFQSDPHFWLINVFAKRIFGRRK